MIEREKKLLVNKDEFERILEVAKELYSDISPKVISQTNYYYDTPELSLYKKGITLRVREKNGKFVIEEKINRLYESDGTRIAEEKKTPTDSLPDKIDSFSLLGQLSTERTRYSLADGTNIDLDISRYFDVTDYEIEIEIGQTVPEDFISHLPAEPNSEMGKYSRFLSRKIALFSEGEMTAMNKKLPFTSDAILKTFPFFTNFFGILQSRGYDVRGTAYNNFIMLAYVLRLDYFFFTAGFPEGRKIRKHFLHEKMPKVLDKPIEYLKENIDKDRYAIIILNNQHLSNVPFDREWYHDWMIYGYNDEDRVFYAAGTIVDTSCHAFVFREIEIGYDELITALPGPKTKTNYHQKFMNNCLYWLPENFKAEPINLRKIRRNIFFYGNNILPLCFNAKTYRKYSFVLNLYHKKNEKQFDLRPFKSLHEHKQLILQMMKDFLPDSKISEEYQSIINLANTIQVAALRYNMTKRGKEKTLEIIDDAFKKMRVEEPRILRQFYKELKGVKN